MHGWRHSAVSFIYLLINKFSVREVALAVYEHLYSLEYIYIYVYIYIYIQISILKSTSEGVTLYLPSSKVLDMA